MPQQQLPSAEVKIEMPNLPKKDVPVAQLRALQVPLLPQGQGMDDKDVQNKAAEDSSAQKRAAQFERNYGHHVSRRRAYSSGGDCCCCDEDCCNGCCEGCCIGCACDCACD